MPRPRVPRKRESAKAADRKIGDAVLEILRPKAATSRPLVVATSRVPHLSFSRPSATPPPGAGTIAHNAISRLRDVAFSRTADFAFCRSRVLSGWRRSAQRPVIAITRCREHRPAKSSNLLYLLGQVFARPPLLHVARARQPLEPRGSRCMGFSRQRLVALSLARHHAFSREREIVEHRSPDSSRCRLNASSR